MAMAFFSCAVGAGFASGQEILQYYAAFGRRRMAQAVIRTRGAIAGGAVAGGAVDGGPVGAGRGCDIWVHLRHALEPKPARNQKLGEEQSPVDNPHSKIWFEHQPAKSSTFSGKIPRPGNLRRPGAYPWGGRGENAEDPAWKVQAGCTQEEGGRFTPRPSSPRPRKRLRPRNRHQRRRRLPRPQQRLPRAPRQPPARRWRR